jgi:hypothetical protein
MFKIQSVKKADTSFRVEGDETVHLVNLPSILHDIAVLLEIAEELGLVVNLIGRDRGTEILQGPVPRPIRQWNLIYDNSLGRRNERVDDPPAALRDMGYFDDVPRQSSRRIKEPLALIALAVGMVRFRSRL